MRLIIVALVSLMLAFSVNAQQTYTLDPEMNISAKSESVSVLRAQPIAFTPIGKRAVAPPTEPNVWFNFQGAITLTPAIGGGVRATISFPSVPIGTVTERKMWRPDGVLVFHATEFLTVLGPPGGLWWMQVWEGFFPEDWPEGDVLFELFITEPGRRRGRAFAVASNTARSQLRALSDSSGGVLLVGGVFLTSPFVIDSLRPAILPVEGGNYIPPSAGVVPGRALTICSGVNGDPLNLECTTATVEPL